MLKRHVWKETCHSDFIFTHSESSFPFTFIPKRKLVLNYARSSGRHSWHKMRLHGICKRNDKFWTIEIWEKHFAGLINLIVIIIIHFYFHSYIRLFLTFYAAYSETDQWVHILTLCSITICFIIFLYSTLKSKRMNPRLSIKGYISVLIFWYFQCLLYASMASSAAGDGWCTKTAVDI